MCSPAVPCRLDQTAIFLDAASHEEYDLVEKMLDEGFDPNVATADGLTALHQAAIEASLRVASLLVKKGANVNAIDNDWWTPLHAAAACDHWRIVNLLLSNGAQTDVINVDGDLPLEIAEGDKTRQLIESEMDTLGLDEEARSRIRGRDELMFTAKVKMWIADGVDLNFRGPSNETPLHIAAANGWADACTALCTAGASVSAQDEDGDTPIHVAAFFEQYKIVEILGAAGAKVSAMNRFLSTPMVMTDDATMIRLLKAVASNQKIKRDETATKVQRGRSGSSAKRMSNAAKYGASKADARRMQEEALKYAQANAPDSDDVEPAYSSAAGDGDNGGDDSKGGEVVYASATTNDTPAVVVSQDLYSVPTKMPNASPQKAKSASLQKGEAAAASPTPTKPSKGDATSQAQSPKKKSKPSKKERKKSKREAKGDAADAKTKKDGTCTVC